MANNRRIYTPVNVTFNFLLENAANLLDLNVSLICINRFLDPV